MSDRGWVGVLGWPGVAAVMLAGLALAPPAVAATWRIQPTPNPPGTTASVVGSVVCPKARACTAVGGFFGGPAAQTTALALRWDGRHWALQATPTPAGTQASWLSGVSCPSAAACTAVGYIIRGVYGTLAERWDGHRWAIQPTPNPAGAQTSLLSTVSCVSARVCTAVGSYYNHHGEQVTLAERWNGTSWAVQATPNPPIRPPVVGNSPTLGDVVCPSAATCTAIGSYYRGSGDVTLAERWNGDRWAIQRIPDPAPVNYPGGLSCPSSNACTAVGMSLGPTGHFFTYAERWDGRRWTLQRTPHPAAATDSGLYDVSCKAASTCTAVGNFINRAGAHLTLAERYS